MLPLLIFFGKDTANYELKIRNLKNLLIITDITTITAGNIIILHIINVKYLAQNTDRQPPIDHLQLRYPMSGKQFQLTLKLNQMILLIINDLSIKIILNIPAKIKNLRRLCNMIY